MEDGRNLVLHLSSVVGLPLSDHDTTFLNGVTLS